jgi:hypothetical protein
MGGLIALAVVLGLIGALVVQSKRAARFKSERDEERADAKARETYDAAVDDWAGGGGLGGGMHDPE